MALFGIASGLFLWQQDMTASLQAGDTLIAAKPANPGGGNAGNSGGNTGGNAGNSGGNTGGNAGNSGGTGGNAGNSGGTGGNAGNSGGGGTNGNNGGGNSGGGDSGGSTAAAGGSKAGGTRGHSLKSTGYVLQYLFNQHRLTSDPLGGASLVGRMKPILTPARAPRDAAERKERQHEIVCNMHRYLENLQDLRGNLHPGYAGWIAERMAPILGERPEFIEAALKDLPHKHTMEEGGVVHIVDGKPCDGLGARPGVVK